MKRESLAKLFVWQRTRAAVWVGIGLAGLVVNLFPVEIFPGVHLMLGSTLGILAGLKFGPAGGGVAGLIAGLPTISLWHQSFPFSALLFALEGSWVGYATKRGKRGPLAAALSYWLLLGSWLTLAGQLVLFGDPASLAFIIQARSLINGILSGLLVEIAIWGFEVFRRWRPRSVDEPAKLRLESLVTIILASVIALPLLYISTTNARNMRERMMSDLSASALGDVSGVRHDVEVLLQNYKRAVAVAAATISGMYQERDRQSLATLLSDVRDQYPDFAGMYVADADARTIAFDPSHSESGENLVGTTFKDRTYYHDLLATKATVFSDVYQARGGMLGPTVAIGEPVFDKAGNFSGFVLGWFDLKSFQNIVTKYKHEGEAIILVDAKGQRVADSSLEHGAYKEVKSLAKTEDFGLVKDKQVDGGEYYSSSGGDQPYILTTTLIGGVGWRAWSKQSVGPLNAHLQKTYLSQVTVLMLSLLLSLVLGKLMAFLLTKPIIELQHSAERLSAGNLSERPARPKLVTAELDSLYRSFLRMAESIDLSWTRQQELLREVSVAKSEWEATFNAMADSVVITDPNDRIIRANRAFFQLFDIEPVECMGKPLTEVAHPNGNWQFCDVCRVRREGRQAYVMSLPESNSSHKYFAIRVDPVHNSEGERFGTVQVIRDLTEIRRAEAEAEKAGALLRNLVDSAYDAVYATDLTGCLLWANKQAANLLGFETESLVGQSFFSSIHPEDLERAKATFETVLRGEAQKYELRYLLRDDVRHVAVTNSPVYVDGELTTVLGIARDLTEDRLIAEQTRRNDKLRALGQLASGVAHNFNNSLTAVIGYTQMVLNKLHDPVITRHLKTVETAALDAAKMVQRIQNFAQQRQDEALVPADLNHIIRDALELTRSRWRDDARANGIVYDAIFRPSESVILTCDQSALREVFVNLIINAIDSMPAGGRLTVTTSIEQGNAIITFVDTGCGMTEDVRQRIFEPFFTTKGPKGYGMGLAVSYGIIGRHSGEIIVASETGSGTTFTVRLPMKRKDTGSLAGETSVLVTGARTASVLVVDDEAPIRALLADLLRARGHKVLMAEDGLAGLRAIEGAQFDLVITDISMPGMDGWAVISEVRRRCPDTKLVIVTGYGGLVDQVVTGEDADLVDALISKPFNLAEIDSTINDLLLEAQRERRY